MKKTQLSLIQAKANKHQKLNSAVKNINNVEEKVVLMQGKRILAGCLALLMLVGLVPSTASAAAATSIQTVISPIYDEVSAKGFDENGLAVVGKFFSTGDGNGVIKSGVINKEGAYVVPIGAYDYIEDYSDGLASVDKGFIDVKGNLVIAYPHRVDNGFANGFCIIMGENGSWGVINRAGKVIIPCEYNNIVGNFSAGNVVGVKISPDQSSVAYYILSESGTATEVDGIGNTVISSECSQTGAIVFAAGTSPLEPNSTGYVDAEGKQIIPFIYGDLQKTDFSWGGDYLGTSAPNFDNNYLIASKGDKEALLDLKRNIVLDFKYQIILSYNNGLAYVESDGKIGCIDAKGNIVLPFEYDGVSNSKIDNHYLLLKKNYEFGYADLKGNLLVPAIYNLAYELMDDNYFSDKSSNDSPRFVVENDERQWGCVDIKGNVVVPFEYQKMWPFEGGLAAVQKDDKWGFVNTSGKLVIKTTYDDVRDCKTSGLNYVKKGDKWGFIDVNGTQITPFEYDDAFFADSSVNIPSGFIDGLAWVCKDGKYGVIKYTGSSTPIATPTADSIIAKVTNSPVLVDGKTVAFEAYNISGNNYFKLRDIAKAITGSKKQFEIGFDSSANAISITTGKAYTSVGTELKLSDNPSDKSAVVTNSKILINGKDTKLTAYNIGGSNYFKLRDLAAAVDFGVTWDTASSTIGIDTSSGNTK